MGLAGATGFITERLNQLHVGVAAASGELGEHGGKCSKSELKVQQLLPTQKTNDIATTKNKNYNAKYLSLLGSRGQKPGKTGFGVEVGCSVARRVLSWV